MRKQARLLKSFCQGGVREAAQSCNFSGIQNTSSWRIVSIKILNRFISGKLTTVEGVKQAPGGLGFCTRLARPISRVFCENRSPLDSFTQIAQCIF